jgi:hypothetical protein
MEKMYDIGSGKALNVGNSYTYTVLDADKVAYSGFFLTAAGSITISDGTNTVLLTLAANEEVLLNSTTTTIVESSDNVIVFQY